jgi:quercetin dioxygenase-like cupin family protein
MYFSFGENLHVEYTFPHTIQNPIGEKLTFIEHVRDGNTDKLLVENFVRPGSGPPMHTHFLQEEALTVIKGRIGYVMKGQQPKFAEEGETVVFKPGVPHRFWNAGDDELHCKGYVTPANTIMFFLSSIYAAQNKSGSGRPDMFDGAYLLKRYASEYDMDAPWFVKKVLIPFTYFVGKLMGKYKHFEGAPPPVRSTVRETGDGRRETGDGRN